MPELPEVETVRRDLQSCFAGRRIDAVTVTGARSTRRHRDVEAFRRRITGRRLRVVDRRGKYLLGRLEGGEVLVVHLGMSGQLRRAEPGWPRAAHTHVVWDFDGGAELHFVDPRTFGQTWVTGTDRAGNVVELAHLGPDALLGLPTWAALAALAAGRRTRLKPLLMDQRVVAGIGNLYADEILFAARLRGDRVAGALDDMEIQALHRAMSAVLTDAITHRGSSLADAQYRDLEGRRGAYQARHAVYGREGLPCRRCATPVMRVKAAGRSSFWCPSCQP